MQKDCCPHILEAFDYTRAEPLTIQETAGWVAVYKPPRLPTAPLREGEAGTLVHWFLRRYAHTRAAEVRGKKAIEAGLLHRLDTDTRGLVLFAKNQHTYDFFSIQQETGRIVKTYYAFVSPDTTETAGKTADLLPYTVISQFRNFGPGAKKAAAVFPHSRHYRKEGRLYTTVITAVESKNDRIAVRCSLQRGYRHQVRVHLASLGLPIAGDPLYGRAETSAVFYGLQLYAVGLVIPDPENPGRSISVELPLPDKMNP